MARTELIKGVLFEVIRPDTKKAQGIVSSIRYFIRRYGYRDINEAYNRPSLTKMKIYLYWSSFFSDLSIYNYGVMGANSMAFSIGAIDYKNGNIYYITKSHNYIIMGVVFDV